MRQKYILSTNEKTKEMLIQEYAVVDNDSYRKDKYLLTDADFVLLSEQNYAISAIKAAIAKDRDVLIDTLRIREFFRMHPKPRNRRQPKRRKPRPEPADLSGL